MSAGRLGGGASQRRHCWGCALLLSFGGGQGCAWAAWNRTRASCAQNLSMRPCAVLRDGDPDVTALVRPPGGWCRLKGWFCFRRWDDNVALRRELSVLGATQHSQQVRRSQAKSPQRASELGVGVLSVWWFAISWVYRGLRRSSQEGTFRGVCASCVAAGCEGESDSAAVARLTVEGSRGWSGSRGVVHLGAAAAQTSDDPPRGLASREHAPGVGEVEGHRSRPGHHSAGTGAALSTRGGRAMRVTAATPT